MGASELNKIKEVASQWLDKRFDKETREKVEYLLENDEKELTESFYTSLEFGTGGLRGIMGVGTNRMNIYTVGMATQGLCNYLNQQFKENISVAIAYDCRNNSRLFAETAASIFSANGIKAYLFDELKPTPELSFAIRHFGCKSGVVVTASHNPKEYNGYKVYWEDGGQIIAPHDKNIIKEVKSIKNISEVKFERNDNMVQMIGAEIDSIYIEKVKELSLNPLVIEKQSSMGVVYTPIHGTGVKLAPMTLQRFGFSNIIHVQEQDVTDGNFPTVHSPNPEEPSALEMAIARAKESGAEIVMATDPDSDRVGIAVVDNEGEFVLLNGNQTAAILIEYLLSQWKENDKLKGREYIVKTIVTTELLVDIANNYGVEYYDVLTGFKFIADIIRKNEGEKLFIGGGEESYGYLAGEFVRDKDAIMSCALIAEAAAYYREKGKSLLDQLKEIYIKYGYYKESLVSVVRKGKKGVEEINTMMQDFRTKPPKEMDGSLVIEIKDYQEQICYNIIEKSRTEIDLPKSNVLQFLTKDGTKVSIRPSGTEPKIKFYFSVKSKLKNENELEKVSQQMGNKIRNIAKELKLN